MKVLLVEEDQELAHKIEEKLKEQGLRVDALYSWHDGRDYAVMGIYDLFLIDVTPPSFGGLALSVKLRRDKVNAPILMIGESKILENIAKDKSISVDGFFPKPVSLQDLLNKIREVLSEPRDMPNETLIYRNLSLNMRSLQVRVGDKRVGLTEKEALLLAYLLEKRGKIVTRQELIKTAWDYDGKDKSKSLEIHIGRLRRKIEKSFKDQKHLIQTIRGLGYKIDNE